MEIFTKDAAVISDANYIVIDTTFVDIFYE